VFGVPTLSSLGFAIGAMTEGLAIGVELVDGSITGGTAGAAAAGRAGAGTLAATGGVMSGDGTGVGAGAGVGVGDGATVTTGGAGVAGVSIGFGGVGCANRSVGVGARRCNGSMRSTRRGTSSAGIVLLAACEAGGADACALSTDVAAGCASGGVDCGALAGGVGCCAATGVGVSSAGFLATGGSGFSAGSGVTGIGNCRVDGVGVAGVANTRGVRSFDGVGSRMNVGCGSAAGMRKVGLSMRVDSTGTARRTAGASAGGVAVGGDGAGATSTGATRISGTVCGAMSPSAAEDGGTTSAGEGEEVMSGDVVFATASALASAAVREGGGPILDDSFGIDV
jgi:hypothetical protein